MASDNPGFQSDDFDLKSNFRGNYQIPRVGLNKDSSNRVSAEECARIRSFSGPTYDSVNTAEEPDKEKSSNFIVTLSSGDEDPDDDDDDYSLRSYFKDIRCYKGIEDQLLSLREKIALSNLLRKVAASLLLVAYIGYFIAVLLLPSKIQGEDYWCKGDGFLIIITTIVFIFLFYFKIFKVFIGKKLFKLITQRMKESSSWEALQNALNLWYVNLIIYITVISCLLLFLIIDSRDDRSRLISLLGIFVLTFLGFIFSVAPRKVIWRQVIWGLGLQFLLGLLILRWSVGRSIFVCLGQKVNTFLAFSDKGSEFVYGELVSKMGIFAFKILTVILFFSFCVQILYYYGAMQWVVMKLGWLLQVTVGTTACESVNASANIFLGMSEAPLLIKPFVPLMTKSELHAVLTGGFATIAGAVLAAYISFGVDSAHLLSASVMSAPAALGFSKLVYPEVETSRTKAKDIKMDKGSEANVLHAACEGVVTSLPLVANIAANLIAFIAFLAFVDAVLNWMCVLVNVEDNVCTLSNVFGYIFMPLAWIMGVPWQDCYYVGQLIGTKTIVNEFVGYLKLAEYQKEGIIMKRSEIIATYALCGFSNIASIGIQIGALGSLVPERRSDLAQIAFRAMITGSVACFLTACVAGCLITADETTRDVLSNSTMIL
ncbi:UNVERIFIED_CONTAM: hypothetical protein RMT77_005746 [Armadillidium vulgare]